MAFGKAVIAKTLDLPETAFGEFPLIMVGEHALDEFFAKLMDLAIALPGRHGPAQLVGFAGREAGADHGDLHGLFLEQGDAQGPRQHILQFG